jgi:hypothetical protein
MAALWLAKLHGLAGFDLHSRTYYKIPLKGKLIAQRLTASAGDSSSSGSRTEHIADTISCRD